jgi:two-component system CheB/CheR fusion protein
VWNRRMEEMWGLRADEVHGQPLLHLDMGLPVEQLKPPVRAVLDARAEVQEVMLDAMNRRGRPVRCHVTVGPLWGVSRELQGAVIVVEQTENGAPPTAGPRSDGTA